MNKIHKKILGLFLDHPNCFFTSCEISERVNIDRHLVRHCLSDLVCIYKYIVRWRAGTEDKYVLDINNDTVKQLMKEDFYNAKYEADRLFDLDLRVSRDNK